LHDFSFLYNLEFSFSNIAAYLKTISNFELGIEDPEIKPREYMKRKKADKKKMLLLLSVIFLNSFIIEKSIADLFTNFS